MKKVRLLLLALVLGATFTACEQNADLDELLNTTDIESVESSTDDDDEEGDVKPKENGNGG